MSTHVVSNKAPSYPSVIDGIGASFNSVDRRNRRDKTPPQAPLGKTLRILVRSAVALFGEVIYTAPVAFLQHLRS